MNIHGIGIKLGTPTLLIALQCCSGDLQAALDLAKLIGMIERQPRQDVEFAVLYNRSIKEPGAQAVLDAAGGAFISGKYLIQSKRWGTGWPAGCNDLWQSGMQIINQRFKSKVIKSKYVLTLEADCIPARHDWISVLINECALMEKDGKDCCGSLVSNQNCIPHINGNAIFRSDMIGRYGALQSSGGPWDVIHGNLMVGITRPTPYIMQKYGCHDSLSVEQVAGLRNEGVIPAFIHGIKNSSGRDAIRSMIEDGSFFEGEDK